MQIQGILDKVASKDKDFRYMATSDLLTELSKETFKVDPELEKKLCNVVAVQLEDQSADISALALRCLKELVRRVGEARALELTERLCDKVLTVSKKDSNARDVASIGLKTVIEAASGNLAPPLAALVSSRMAAGVQQKESPDVLQDSLDILVEVLGRFGHLVQDQHQLLLSTVLPHLDDHRAGVRKRALQCIGAVAPFLHDSLLDQVTQHLISKLQGGGLKPDIVRTYVQGLGIISKAVGYRYGRYLSESVPLVIQYGHKASEGDDELREFVLQALENFVEGGPGDVKPFMDKLLTEALTYLRYDPNYADDMDEDGGGDEGSEAEEEEDDVSEEDYSDDEDMSWKVRRCAVKLLSAIIEAYPDQVSEVYSKAASELVSRFREREESVKADIFGAMSSLLKQVGVVSSRYDQKDPASPLQLLSADVPPLIKAAARQLNDKSLKTRIGMFTVLHTLVGVLPSSVADHVGALVPGILSACKDKSASSSSVKIEALSFLRAALEVNSPAVFKPHVEKLSTGVFAAAAERYYKVAAEGLRVCERLVRVLREDVGQTVDSDMVPVAKGMYSCISGRLAAQDQDQEVKEAAILGMAALIAQLGDVLKDEVPAVLSKLLDRLRNEITRLPAVKAFATLAHSPLELGLDASLDASMPELTSFLRKANRQLRSASLVALEALAAKYGRQISAAAVAALVPEAAALISDADLSLAAQSLKLFVTLCKAQPDAAAQVAEAVLPAALSLVTSPLLQGAALSELQAFFPALASSNAPTAQPDTLLKMLLDAGRGRRDRGADAAGHQAQRCVAQCVAMLVVKQGQQQVTATVTELLQMLKSADPASQHLALLCLGEVGRRTDLSGVSAVDGAINTALSSDSEDIKTAASLALGGVACGNLAKYLPTLLNSIQGSSSNSKQQYLLLQALNEVVTTVASRRAKGSTATADVLDAGQLQQVLDLLATCSSAEEECRNVVAECFGRLALLHPSEVVVQLQQGLSSGSEHTRGVVVGAVKYMVVDKPHALDDLLKDCLLDFLKLLGDSDRHVRKAAVVALSAVVHHKPGLVTTGLPQLLPLLFDQTVIKPEMIRTVDLGPFKHRIDDGLELRKATFECLDILLTALPHVLQSEPAFLTALESGLKDHQDVKAPAHLMLAKLASSPGGAPVVLAQLDKLVEPLEKTLTAKLKSDAVKQEVDRHEEMLRSCLRAVDALHRLPGAEASQPFTAFLKRTVVSNGPLKDKYLAVQQERAEAEGDAMDVV